MTAVTFYHVKTPQQMGKLRLVCQLASTAYKKGHKVYVRARDDKQCDLLNQMLWTFAASSFVPHTSLTEDRDPDLEKFPVVIGAEHPPEKFSDVLITLQDEIPSYAYRFQRVVEPVDADARDEARAKAKFAEYKSLFDTEPATYYI